MSRNLANAKLTTTPCSVRSGRNPAYFPILALPDGPQIDDITQVLGQYPAGAYLKKVSDRHRVLSDIYDIVAPFGVGTRKLARYRKHPLHGWLEELSLSWSMNSDYPTALATSQIIDFEDQGALNITTAMRFGVQIIALLLGSNDPAIRNEVLDILAKIMIRSGEDIVDLRVEVIGEQIKLIL